MPLKQAGDQLLGLFLFSFDHLAFLKVKSL